MKTKKQNKKQQKKDEREEKNIKTYKTEGEIYIYKYGLRHAAKQVPFPPMEIESVCQC